MNKVEFMTLVRDNFAKEEPELLKILEATGQLGAAVSASYRAILDSIVETLNTGDEVKLKGFGKFYVIYKKPYTRVNNLTGAEENVSGRVKVKFKSSYMIENGLTDKLL